MKGLNRTQLKFIAICGMVCDHIAWGFVDFFTPLGQIMHIIGRLTIPIMCFFIAEGFRNTSNIRGYFRRMLLFWIISIIPFYLFFGEMYDYRQNIIFDLLLGLSTLGILENATLKKWQKTVFTTLIFFLSAFISGWPILPIVYILIFYYIKDFKKQSAWICTATITLVVVLAISIKLNDMWHFSHYEWIWYEKLYFLGFMLPLLLLKHYNGEKGGDIGGKYFFYIFYPAHFLVLFVTKQLVGGFTPYEIYVFIHILALALCVAILITVAFVKPSRAQSATLFFAICASIYTFGFLLEITSSTIEAIYVAVVVQYFGESLLIIGLTLLIKEFCHKAIPAFIFAIEIVVCIFTMWCLFTVNDNHFFYTSMAIDYSGPFPRLDLSYGPGFYIVIGYLAITCVVCMKLIITTYHKSPVLEKKRLLNGIFAIISVWMPFLIRGIGLTGGYEVTGIGVIFAAYFIRNALIKYGYFDSITLASENALNHGHEGILVINTNHQIIYYNKRIEKIFGTLILNQNAYENEKLEGIFRGLVKQMEIGDRIYEMRTEPLMESGYVQAYMLWALDITEHHNTLLAINKIAHTDTLTGIFNRHYFTTQIEFYLNNSGSGAMFMMDLDNFKQINDGFGHQAGDEILKIFAGILSGFDEAACIPCRLGGDEFCMFFRKITDHDRLASYARKIIDEFAAKLAQTKYAGVTAVSIGIAACNDEVKSFTKLYSNADKAVYLAKNSGKNQYRFFE